MYRQTQLVKSLVHHASQVQIQPRITKLRRLYLIENPTEADVHRVQNEMSIALPDTYFGQKRAPVRIYSYDGERKILAVPRQYGIETFGTPQQDETIPGKDFPRAIPLQCTFRTDWPQEECVQRIVAQCKERGGALAEVGCGMGKTLVMIACAIALGGKTLFLCDRECITGTRGCVIASIRKFCGPQVGVAKMRGSDVGKSAEAAAKQSKRQQEKIDKENETKAGTETESQVPLVSIDEADFVVGNIQTLFADDCRIPRKWLNQFRTVIVDEVHSAAAPKYCNALARVSCRYMIGVTGTLQRPDGLDVMLPHFFGPVACCYQTKDQPLDVHVLPFETKYEARKIYRTGKVDYTHMLKQITMDNNELINQKVNLMLNYVEQGRRAIYFGHYVQELKHVCLVIRQSLRARNMKNTVAHLKSNMKEDERNEASKADILVATANLCSKGFDSPTLSVGVLCENSSPLTNTQCIGRVTRPVPGKPKPVIILVKHIDHFGNLLTELKYAFYRRIQLLRHSGKFQCRFVEQIGSTTRLSQYGQDPTDDYGQDQNDENDGNDANVADTEDQEEAVAEGPRNGDKPKGWFLASLDDD